MKPINPLFLISDKNGIWGNKLPQKELQLSYFAKGEIKDLDILKLILDLFKEMIDKLYEMRSIDYKQ